ncbi:hypothetical protein EDD21DRAFT_161804 [Dissophora ornata]|nr:Glutathione S-transferase S1 [Dissophora ornata]KAI8599380.1 hypothetical protein EDD21DRAFT_161804 [Dissophora ornata]
MVHAFFDPAQTATLQELSLRRDSTFEIKYFGLHGLGAMCRLLLAVSGASFKSVAPAEWAVEKSKTPFGLIPILTETSADGSKTIKIAESDAIVRYLAKKFGMIGDNAFEEVLVDTFVGHTHALNGQIYLKYLAYTDASYAELKRDNKEKLVTGPMADWAKYHEEHLKANGSNGHYVANKLTLADLMTAQLVVIIQSITGEDLVSKEKTPAIWKVKTTVEEIPSYAAWRATEEYKALSERNFNILGFH